MRAVPGQIAARLTAAAELFADRGVDNTKIEDVAAATGVPKATLYYYFAGKEEILAFLLADTLQRMADEVVIAVEQEGTAAERLARVIQAQLTVMAEQPAVCRALLGDLGRAGRIPDIAAAIRNAYSAPVETLLVQGAQDGSLLGTVEPVAAAAAVFGATSISGLSYLVAGQPLDPPLVAQAVGRVVLDGLRPR